MAVALLALLFLGFLALLLNTLIVIPPLGEWSASLLHTSFISLHFSLGVIAAFLCLFGVVMTMFYFIGTGKAVKEEVRDHDLDKRYYRMVLKYKKQYFPVMTLSLLLYIAVPTMGAAAHADYIAPGFHGMVAYLTLATHGYICYRGSQYIFENDRLVSTVNRLVLDQS